MMGEEKSDTQKSQNIDSQIRSEGYGMARIQIYPEDSDRNHGRIPCSKGIGQVGLFHQKGRHIPRDRL